MSDTDYLTLNNKFNGIQINTIWFRLVLLVVVFFSCSSPPINQSENYKCGSSMHHAPRSAAEKGW